MKTECIHNFISNGAYTLNTDENVLRQKFKCSKCGDQEYLPIKDNPSSFDKEDTSFKYLDIYSGHRFMNNNKNDNR